MHAQRWKARTQGWKLACSWSSRTFQSVSDVMAWLVTTGSQAVFSEYVSDSTLQQLPRAWLRQFKSNFMNSCGNSSYGIKFWWIKQILESKNWSKWKFSLPRYACCAHAWSCFSHVVSCIAWLHVERESNFYMNFWGKEKKSETHFHLSIYSTLKQNNYNLDILSVWLVGAVIHTVYFCFSAKVPQQYAAKASNSKLKLFHWLRGSGVTHSLTERLTQSQ